ncbi:MAG: transposase family protein [Streptosporangiaceae bacterium]
MADLSRSLRVAPRDDLGDPLRRSQTARHCWAFALAVALVCVLAGARSFRQVGDLPQEMLAALGGVPRPLRRKIPVPSEKRIRTLLQDLDGDALDVIIGGWLRSLAAAIPLPGPGLSLCNVLVTATAASGSRPAREPL